jgi:2-amino-4-hydroxy-6-hydroxymethyldihydropteridine diphosphokinase
LPNAPGDYYTLVGVGSNEGDSVALVLAAIEALRAFAQRDFRASRLWRTSPVDCPPDAADFVNAVVGFVARAALTPEALLESLKNLEREHGRREATVRNAPRALDLDLLVFGDVRRATADFVLPHPRGHLRRFVLAPAAEIAPDLAWPGTGRRVADLLAGLPPDEERVVPI